MKIEELNALRDAKDAAAAQVTEEYMSNLTEGPPDEAAVQELQAEAKYLAVQRFTKFNSPRFVREYDREIELLVCVTMYNVRCVCVLLLVVVLVPPCVAY